MNGMAEIYQRELSKLLQDAYWLAMRDWSIEDFEAAASHLMQNSKWFPKPSEFADLRKAAKPGPAEAWLIALSSCKDWRNPEMLPQGAIAEAAKAVGGFRQIAMSDTERELPHVQRRFQEAYAEITARKEIVEAVPQIADASKLRPRINHGVQPLSAALPALDRRLQNPPVQASGKPNGHSLSIPENVLDQAFGKVGR
jgi:hypothetical protein